MKAPVVHRIFQLYAEGKLGTTAIARTLEAEGAPSAGPGLDGLDTAAP